MQAILCTIDCGRLNIASASEHCIGIGVSFVDVMNTIRSTWYGWATLCVAGGGAYYFAKKQINSDRADRYKKERLQQERLHRLETSTILSGGEPYSKSQKPAHRSQHLDPSDEASMDPAPAKLSAEIPEHRKREKSKYEAAEPFRSKKGDRFS